MWIRLTRAAVVLTFVLGFLGGYVMTVGNKIKAEEAKDQGKKVNDGPTMEMQGAH